MTPWENVYSCNSIQHLKIRISGTVYQIHKKTACLHKQTSGWTVQESSYFWLRFSNSRFSRELIVCNYFKTVQLFIMTQSKTSIQSKKIEQVLNLKSLLLSRFCRVNTTYKAERLIEVNHIKYFL